MHKFYNRQQEIDTLEKIYQASKSEAHFTYIVGLRRLGKTYLVKHFFSEKQKKDLVFYFFVGRKTEKALLTGFSEVLKTKLDYVPEFNSLKAFLEFLINLSKTQHFSLIFDEFQNFEYVNPAFFSDLQDIWDSNKQSSKLNLLCIGSLFSSMEKIFMDQHEPLYGRADHKIELKEFSLNTLKEIISDYTDFSLEKLLELYTLFGGVPKYYDDLRKQKLFNKSTKQIFKTLFLDVGSTLHSEGRDKIIQEFGPNSKSYFSMLEAIAVYQSTNNAQIANFTGITEHHTGTYLKKLAKDYSLIKRNCPLLNPKSKQGRYKITDNLTAIWFKYIYSRQSFIEQGNYEYVLNKFTKNFRSDAGMVFEDLVLKILQSNYHEFPYDLWGKYWNNNLEIDLFAINKTTQKAFVAECKLKHLDISVALNLKNKIAALEKIFASFTFTPFIFSLAKDLPSKIEGIRVLGGNDLENLLN